MVKLKDSDPKTWGDISALLQNDGVGAASDFIFLRSSSSAEKMGKFEIITSKIFSTSLAYMGQCTRKHSSRDSYDYYVSFRLSTQGKLFKFSKP